MPKIFPFKAMLYSDQLRKSIGALLSPPYDVISTEGFARLRALSPYQSVQLALAGDSNDPERYEKMKDLYREWKSSGVLTQHTSKAFYLVEDRFESEGHQAIRIGFIALLEVSPFERKEILPHEYTLSGPKKDRLELLKTMRAELSQIFLCYQDPDLVVETIHRSYSERPALAGGRDTSGIHRRLWAIERADEIQRIQALVASSPALIADGHHRYETAVSFSKEAPFAQVYFTNLKSPGFSIHPIHRIFNLPATIGLQDFLTRLASFFEIIPWTKNVSVAELAAQRETGKLKLFASFEASRTNVLLSQKRKSDLDAEIFSIHRDVFEGILGWNIGELAKGTIQYEHETKDYFDRLHSMKNSVGLFLPPTDLEVVMRLAEKGERMPQKSTFFYPKLASGLVNFDLDNF